MYFFSRGGRLGAVYVFFRGRGRGCIFFRGAGWLGAVYVFFSLRGWAVLGFFAGQDEGAHSASYYNGFGRDILLWGAHPDTPC